MNTRIRCILAVCCVFSATARMTVMAEETLQTNQEEIDKAVFRRATEAERDEKPSGSIVVGDYVLVASAVEQLRKVYTLELKLNELQYHEWDKPPEWTRKNTELTLRQRMDDYLSSAMRFYEGRGKRSSGEVGRREERFTDLELGDRQLCHALGTLLMAATWKAPLLEGQEQQLDRVLKKRLELVKQRPADR